MSTSVLSYNTSNLIDDITTIGHVPVGNSTFTEQKLLDIANTQLETSLLRQMLSVREGYFLTYSDTTPNATGLYPIPTDAIGEKIALVQIVASTAVIQVSRIEISELVSTNGTPANGFTFYIIGNSIQLLPFTSIPGTVRIWYYRRPSRLVLTTDCAKVVSVSSNDVTVDAVPSGWVANDDVDLQQGLPNFKLYGQSINMSAISGSVITLASGASDLVVNDFLVPVNMSCVIQVPVEFRPLLVQRVVVKLYEIQNYRDKMAMAQKKLEEMERDVLSLISPRVQEQTKVIYISTGGVLGSKPIYPAV